MRQRQGLRDGGNKFNDQGPITDTIEVLDLSVSTPSWTYLTRMKEPRYHCAATVDADANIIITGGRCGEELLNSVEVFDTRNQVWNSSLPPMLSRRYEHCIVALREGKLLVAIGGQVRKWESTASVELLQRDDGGPLRWIPLPSINVGVAGFAAFAATTTTQQGIFVGGGRIDFRYENVVDTVEFLQVAYTPRDLVYWNVVNPPPLTKLDLTIKGPVQRSEYRAKVEKWIQDLHRQRDEYRNKVENAISEIRSCDEEETSKWATPAAERIKNLADAFNEFRDDVAARVTFGEKHVLNLDIKGTVITVGNPPSLSSVSNEFPEEFDYTSQCSEDRQQYTEEFVQGIFPTGNVLNINRDETSSVSSTFSR